MLNRLAQFVVIATLTFYSSWGIQRGLKQPSAEAAVHCGSERWAIKTLADFAAPKVLQSPLISMSITEMTTAKAPDKARLEAATAQRFPEEMNRVTVSALVIGYKREGDSDFHIVLADPQNPRVTLIAEIPHPGCVPPAYVKTFAFLQNRFVHEFGAPTARFRKLTKPVLIQATGVAFFDFLHGQTGVAPNGIELHPLLDWEK